MDGYCTACRHDVSVTGARHNQAGKCPRCGRTVTFKPTGRIGRLFDRATAQVIQRTGENGLVIRIFKVSKSYRDFREPKPRVWENARIFVEWNRGKTTVTPFYYSYWNGILTHWRKGIRPGMNKWAYNFEQDVCGYLYHRDLDAVLKETPWRYSQLKRFYLRDREPMEVVPYLNAYTRYPLVEYLVKLGFTRLASYVVYDRGYSAKSVNLKGKNLREIMGVGQEDIPMLQRVNADEYTLELFQALKSQRTRMGAGTESLLRWFQANNLRTVPNVTYPLRFTTPKKLLRYVERQFERLRGRRFEKLGSVLSEYRDYLMFCNGLEYDLTNDFVLFPGNLQTAHDQAGELFSGDSAAGYGKLIRADYPTLLERYGYRRNNLRLTPPQTAEEIVAEGHTLRHCVGGYIQRIARGESVILFLRRENAPSKPFYTVELIGGRLNQARGIQNNAPTPEVRRFLDAWARDVLQGGEKAA
jgi:hypothetical protein